MSADKSGTDGLMEALEMTGPFVSMLTGVKQQFVEAGWSQASAEAAAIEILRAPVRGTR